MSQVLETNKLYWFNREWSNRDVYGCSPYSVVDFLRNRLTYIARERFLSSVKVRGCEDGCSFNSRWHSCELKGASLAPLEWSECNELRKECRKVRFSTTATSSCSTGTVVDQAFCGNDDVRETLLVLCPGGFMKYFSEETGQGPCGWQAG